MARVLVGMSGGVDSAVAAYLLKQEGHEVIGVTLRTWQGDSDEDSRCCEIDDARMTAEIIGIRYHPHNCLSLFGNRVVKPFVNDYLEGLTPNPCIECNKYVKWDKMMELTHVFDAQYVATGHYANIVKLNNGRYTVKKALHAAKDQTYMLYKLTQEHLSHTLMPIGSYTKDEVRAIAAEIGLPCANKSDSQEICFVTEGKYQDFIKEHSDRPVPGEGRFVDTSGNVLGTHKGIYQYTVGQRKGLGIALGEPAYVTRICPEDNTVVLGKLDDIMCSSFFCTDTNFLSIEDITEEPVRCFVKARYHQPERSAYIRRCDDRRVLVTLDDAVAGVSPGQSAVFYDSEGCVIGGGKIDKP